MLITFGYIARPRCGYLSITRLRWGADSTQAKVSPPKEHQHTAQPVVLQFKFESESELSHSASILTTNGTVINSSGDDGVLCCSLLVIVATACQRHPATTASTTLLPHLNAGISRPTFNALIVVQGWMSTFHCSLCQCCLPPHHRRRLDKMQMRALTQTMYSTTRLYFCFLSPSSHVLPPACCCCLLHLQQCGGGHD